MVVLGHWPAKVGDGVVPLMQYGAEPHVGGIIVDYESLVEVRLLKEWHHHQHPFEVLERLLYHVCSLECLPLEKDDEGGGAAAVSYLTMNLW
jgi:hypothetical protein